MKATKMGKCWSKDHVKVLLHTTPNLDRLMLAALVKHGGKHKLGQAPMGALERVISKLLNQ